MKILLLHGRKLVTRFPLPSLRGIRVGLSAKPEILGATRLPVEEYEQSPAVDLPLQVAEVQPELEPETKIPPEVVVKVLPARTKRKPRSAKVEVTPAPPPPPKPLKVIRRRKEEKPKVFETPPKSVPEAMIAGIKVSQDEQLK